MELINEGGSYGHIMHPYEGDITFGELKILIKDAISSELTEKVDGVALAVTWKNGSIRAARNKGHMKNAGATAMSIEDMDKFVKAKGKGYYGFYLAMCILYESMLNMDPTILADTFKEGTVFMHVEIVSPYFVNVIDYGSTVRIICHTLFLYDEKGRILAERPNELNTLLDNIIKPTNINFKIHKSITLKSINNGIQNEQLTNYFIHRINLYMKEVSVLDESPIHQHKTKLKPIIDELSARLMSCFYGFLTDNTEGMIFKFNGNRYKFTNDFGKLSHEQYMNRFKIHP